MAFIITWDEANPTNATVSVNIDDEIRSAKAAVAERLVGMFSDFRTATDRIHARKIFVDPAGLDFRNDTDTTTLATLTNLGQLTTLLPNIAAAFVTSNAGSVGNIAFSSEVIDTAGFHDNVTNNSRLTVPAGQGGNYFIFGGCLAQLNLDLTGGNLININLRKNNSSNLLNAENYHLRDQGSGLASASIFVQKPIVRFAIANLIATDFMELSYANGSSNGTTASNFFLGMIRLA